jgi:hypothetical protein
MLPIASIVRKRGIAANKANGMPGRVAHCGASFRARINKVVRDCGAGNPYSAPNKTDSAVCVAEAVEELSSDIRIGIVNGDLVFAAASIMQYVPGTKMQWHRSCSSRKNSINQKSINKNTFAIAWKMGRKKTFLKASRSQQNARHKHNERPEQAFADHSLESNAASVIQCCM